MTIYKLLPKISHIGNEIHESQKEFVFYKFTQTQTIEFDVFKTLEEEYIILHKFKIPTKEEILALATLKYKKRRDFGISNNTQ
jgi:hypothetical protein